MNPLPNADEPHKVLSGYWKIILVQPDKTLASIRAASFIFDQNTPRRDKVIDHLTIINDSETRSGLNFLRELPDDLEENIESNKFQTWAQEHFS